MLGRYLEGMIFNQLNCICTKSCMDTLVSAPTNFTSVEVFFQFFCSGTHLRWIEEAAFTSQNRVHKGICRSLLTQWDLCILTNFLMWTVSNWHFSPNSPNKFKSKVHSYLASTIRDSTDWVMPLLDNTIFIPSMLLKGFPRETYLFLANYRSTQVEF